MPSVRNALRVGFKQSLSGGSPEKFFVQKLEQLLSRDLLGRENDAILSRAVNDAAVDATLINGRIAYRRGSEYPEALGTQQGFGHFLPGCDVAPRTATARGFKPATA